MTQSLPLYWSAAPLFHTQDARGRTHTHASTHAGLHIHWMLDNIVDFIMKNLLLLFFLCKYSLFVGYFCIDVSASLCYFCYMRVKCMFYLNTVTEVITFVWKINISCFITKAYFILLFDVYWLYQSNNIWYNLEFDISSDTVAVWCLTITTITNTCQQFWCFKRIEM